MVPIFYVPGAAPNRAPFLRSHMRPCAFPVRVLPHRQEKGDVHPAGDEPADRVGKVQHLGRMVCLKDGGNPQKPYAAGAHHGDEIGRAHV